MEEGTASTARQWECASVSRGILRITHSRPRLIDVSSACCLDVRISYLPYQCMTCMPCEFRCESPPPPSRTRRTC
jgi:hypothetical protein